MDHMTAVNEFLAMRQIIALGVSCLSESRREQWDSSVEKLQEFADDWYRKHGGKRPTGREAANA
jgi:hypothetical protein